MTSSPVLDLEGMRAFLQSTWDAHPLLKRLSALHRHRVPDVFLDRELLCILVCFSAERGGLPVEFVPEGAVQAVRGKGNLSSVRSAPGKLQIEEQVRRSPRRFLAEVTHELCYCVAGGPGRVPRLGESGINGMELLEMMVQAGGKLPI